MKETADQKLWKRRWLEKKEAQLLPNVGIYVGTGSSHSWMWFVDLFESYGLTRLHFYDEKDFIGTTLDEIDALIISGGDTFGVAEALGPGSSDIIKEFVAQGGLYIGSCAGAYLPMHSSKEHLNHFNFVNVKITNLTKTLPQAMQMAHKCYISYGCQYIYHPVREEVKILINGDDPLFSGQVISAPLYGGPGMSLGDGVTALAHYQSFTDKTLYLIDKEIAERTLLGKVAVARADMDKGRFYLFGPHFEHPHYTEANIYLINTIYKEMQTRTVHRASLQAEEQARLTGEQAKIFKRTLRRELSNARIVAYSLETAPVYWKIGFKIYSPPQIAVFIEAMWRRIRNLERMEVIKTTSGNPDTLLEYAGELAGLLRELKARLTSNEDSESTARKIFPLLSAYAKLFFSIYFQSLA